MTTIDKEHEFDPVSKQCRRCKHLLDNYNRECSAFPDGIPQNIWNNEKAHTEIIDGQTGEYIFETNE